jgi:hypothetical protein
MIVTVGIRMLKIASYSEEKSSLHPFPIGPKKLKGDPPRRSTIGSKTL